MRRVHDRHRRHGRHRRRGSIDTSGRPSGKLPLVMVDDGTSVVGQATAALRSSMAQRRGACRSRALSRRQRTGWTSRQETRGRSRREAQANAGDGVGGSGRGDRRSRHRSRRFRRLRRGGIRQELGVSWGAQREAWARTRARECPADRRDVRARGRSPKGEYGLRQPLQFDLRRSGGRRKLSWSRSTRQPSVGANVAAAIAIAFKTIAVVATVIASRCRTQEMMDDRGGRCNGAYGDECQFR